MAVSTQADSACRAASQGASMGSTAAWLSNCSEAASAGQRAVLPVAVAGGRDCFGGWPGGLWGFRSGPVTGFRQLRRAWLGGECTGSGGGSEHPDPNENLGIFGLSASSLVWLGPIFSCRTSREKGVCLSLSLSLRNRFSFFIVCLAGSACPGCSGDGGRLPPRCLTRPCHGLDLK